LVEIIRGKYEKVEDLYDNEEMKDNCLIVMPVANLQMIETNIKNEKKQHCRKKLTYYKYELDGYDFPVMGNPGEPANLHPPVWSGRF
jgi:hypothetical protein